MPTQPRNYSVSIATGSGPYTANFTIPTGTKKLVFKLRAAGSSLLWSWFDDDRGIPGGKYMTLPSGTSMTYDGLDTNENQKIYFQCADVSQVVEIEVWR